jgi:hypothetical protein
MADPPDAPGLAHFLGEYCFVFHELIDETARLCYVQDRTPAFAQILETKIELCLALDI